MENEKIDNERREAMKRGVATVGALFGLASCFTKTSKTEKVERGNIKKVTEGTKEGVCSCFTEQLEDERALNKKLLKSLGETLKENRKLRGELRDKEDEPVECLANQNIDGGIDVFCAPKSLIDRVKEELRKALIRPIKPPAERKKRGTTI